MTRILLNRATVGAKTLAADKENVDPEWSEFESPGATAKTAATVETGAEQSFSPLETYGTVCEDCDRKGSGGSHCRSIHPA